MARISRRLDTRLGEAQVKDPLIEARQIEKFYKQDGANRIQVIAPTDDEHGLYGLTSEPTPPSRPPDPRVQRAPAPSVPASAPASVMKSPPPPRQQTPGGYTHRLTITLNPQIVPWVAPVCLVLVFVLSFFPWVGRFYGSYDVLTQSAWGAAFGGYTRQRCLRSGCPTMR